MVIIIIIIALCCGHCRCYHTVRVLLRRNIVRLPHYRHRARGTTPHSNRHLVWLSGRCESMTCQLPLSINYKRGNLRSSFIIIIIIITPHSHPAPLLPHSCGTQTVGRAGNASGQLLAGQAYEHTTQIPTSLRTLSAKRRRHSPPAICTRPSDADSSRVLLHKHLKRSEMEIDFHGRDRNLRSRNISTPTTHLLQHEGVAWVSRSRGYAVLVEYTSTLPWEDEYSRVDAAKDSRPPRAVKPFDSPLLDRTNASRTSDDACLVVLSLLQICLHGRHENRRRTKLLGFCLLLSYHMSEGIMAIGFAPVM